MESSCKHEKCKLFKDKFVCTCKVKMYCCEVCGFETGRLANFERHLNRKTPCKKKISVVPNDGFVVPCVVSNDGFVVPNREFVVPNEGQVVPSVVPDDLSKLKTQKKIYNCEICGLNFANRQNRYRHVKRGKCKPPPVVCHPIVDTSELLMQEEIDENTTCPYCEKVFSREDNLRRHMKSCHMRHTAGNITNNNTTTTNNTTNNNTTNNNTTNNNNINHITINNIHLNSFDNPSVDHVDMDVIKELYYKTGRNLKKLIHEGVKKIWETNENNSFNVPSFSCSKKIKQSLFQRNETLQVYSDGDHRMLPANHVVDVVLQKAAAVCESHLRRHHYDDNVRGHAVLKHADVLEGLAIEYQETWDEDKKFRDGYKPFVQNALIECMLAASRKSYDSNTCEEE